MWDRHQELKKLTKRGGHLGLDPFESIVNQWTRAQKGLALVKSFGRADPTLRKKRGHMNEPKMTGYKIPRYHQKSVFRLTNQSHADKYRFFNLLTFFRNLGKEQKTDQHHVAKGKKENRHKQSRHYSVSHIMKLLSTKNLDRHQVEQGKQDSRLHQSHTIKLLKNKSRKYARLA